jgi:hypothetical protein
LRAKFFSIADTYAHVTPDRSSAHRSQTAKKKNGLIPLHPNAAAIFDQ